MTTKTTAAGVEVLTSGASNTQTSALGAEVLVSLVETKYHTTAAGVEVLVAPIQGTRVASSGAEVLVSLALPSVPIPLASDDPCGLTDPEPYVTPAPPAEVFTPAEAGALGGRRVRLRWEIDDSEQQVELGGVNYRLRVRWIERTRAWYTSLATSEGEPIVEGRRLSPEWSPLFGLLPPIEVPNGVLVVSGAGLYERDDLGRTLHLTYYPPDGFGSGALDPDRVVSVDLE